jgi:hypothetical protein
VTSLDETNDVAAALLKAENREVVVHGIQGKDRISGKEFAFV